MKQYALNKTVIGSSLVCCNFLCLIINRRKIKGNTEYEYRCEIPYSYLDAGFEYKYCIQKFYDKGEKNFLWECYVKNGHYGEGSNRYLNIPMRMKGNIEGMNYLFYLLTE